MIGRLARQPLRYTIGAVDVALTTSVRNLYRDHSQLYEANRVESDRKVRPHTIQIDVTPTPYSLRHRRRFLVRTGSGVQFEPAGRKEVLPYVEWAVNWEIPKAMPQYLQLHASSLEVDGMGVILPGASGSGKSTLTTGLVASGWRYLCDEFALVDSRSLKLHPYPRAICIKQPAFGVLESIGVSVRGYRHYLKGTKGYVAFVNPHSIRDDVVGRPCPIRYVVFPKYVANVRPSLIPISRADAAFRLHSVCFNLLTCDRLALDVVAGLIRGATCYQLISSDISATCDLMHDLVSGAAGNHAKSA